MTAHTVTITEHETLATDDGRLVYRARCSGCRWIGWAVFDEENAKRQRDRHLEQAEIDAAVLDDDNGRRQWERDHPGGVISDEEQESMDRYGFEACLEEGCHTRARGEGEGQ